MNLNPYLTGNWRPNPVELEAGNLSVQGKIPTDLRGSLLRIGPNPIGPSLEGYHPFLGEGMAYALDLSDPRAPRFKSRYVRTDPVARKLGEELTPGPQPPLWDHSWGYTTGDVSNTSLVVHAGKLLAIAETCLPYELDPSTLGTVARTAFGGTLQNGFSAHPHRHPTTGELHCVSYGFRERPYLTHEVIDASGGHARTHPIDVERPVMVHDCGLTPTYVIVPDLPVEYDPELSQRGWRLPYAWKSSHRARVGLLPNQAGGAPRWFEIDPCFAFHFANAYDLHGDTGEVVGVECDVITWPRLFVWNKLGPGEPSAPRFERWTLRLDQKAVSRRVLSRWPGEFPVVDPRRACLPHRYMWAVTFTILGLGNRLLLFRDGKVVQTAFAGLGRELTEPVFVPRGSQEGHGYVLALRTPRFRGNSVALIYSALELGRGPLASIKLPMRVPTTFHGAWLDAKNI